MNLGKFNCSTGIINILYEDKKQDITVRTSTIKDMLLVDKLQKENSYAVGFIQKTVWEDYVWGGKRNFVVLICEANSDAVGYVLFTPGRKAYTYAKLQQIAVRDDARRLKYGIWEKGKINHVGFKASDDINLYKIDLNTNIIKLL